MDISWSKWLRVSNECVKRILQDQFLESWSGRISVSEEDFSSYKIYKDVHEFEEYVDLLPEYLKYSLINFRTGSQKLPVNCRSKLSIPRQKCNCTKCRKITRCSTVKMTQLSNTNYRKLLMKVAKYVDLGMKECTSVPDVVSEDIDYNCLHMTVNRNIPCIILTHISL